MSRFNGSLDDIVSLMESFSKNGLTSFSLKDGEYELSLGKECAPPAALAADAAGTAAVSPPVPAASPKAPVGDVVVSPIVGTYYDSPAPDKPSFVKVGQRVQKGDVLFIVESMKLMNEVTSECDGTVAETLVSNGQSVEFGTPVMRIEP